MFQTQVLISEDNSDLNTHPQHQNNILLVADTGNGNTNDITHQTRVLGESGTDNAGGIEKCFEEPIMSPNSVVDPMNNIQYQKTTPLDVAKGKVNSFGSHIQTANLGEFISVTEKGNEQYFAEGTSAHTSVGYKSRVDSANQKIVLEEVAKKKEEYQNDMEIMQISKLYETQKIEFKMEVEVGPSPKMVALQAAKNLRATWVILDRQMKKDKKYFMEKLSCGISRIKRDNSVEKLRGPKAMGVNKVLPTDRSCSSHVTYDEMIPGIPEEDDDDLFSLEFCPTMKSQSPPKTKLGEEQGVDSGEGFPSNSSGKTISFPKSASTEHIILTCSASSSSLVKTEASNFSYNEAKYSPSHHQEEEENNTNTTEETVGMGSTDAISDSLEIGETKSNEIGSQNQEEQKQGNSIDDWLAGSQPEELFENSICWVCKNRRPKIGWKGDFSYADLQAATDGFSKENFLSEGGFGSVYRGKLKNGLEIAVKQHKAASFQGEKEFKSEVHVLRKARHKNVVMLLGSCSEGSHRLLIYEYVCNGSLDQHISKSALKPLSWTERVKIALGAARGLNYLHQYNIIHRDMRPNNILVTHDHEPLLGDFGLARTQHEESDNSTETRVVGTFGYLAPEYAESGKVSTKTDVYSFGVVLLELITGCRVIDKAQEGKSLVGWARPLLKEKKYPELIDERILDSHDVHQLFWMVRVAEKCLSKDPEKRLSMDKVVVALQFITYGETVCGIEDFSPAQSDSISSIAESTESQGDEGRIEQESLGTEIASINTSKSQMIGLFSSPSSAQTISTISTRTSSISTSSRRSSSGSEKTNKKKGQKSQSRIGVHYGEMLH
ncbi:hypothetical protein HHK36_011655 [Tetracentron sinense]|uniref:Protein kinase domain-containing protein n=1 Tax=Tetracentron sinense TaxID=13715 RepID=A0A834ZGS8_TETSI|nr:hypothetical protein HHK36_011655 [Tetracentron sinense]